MSKDSDQDQGTVSCLVVFPNFSSEWEGGGVWKKEWCNLQSVPSLSFGDGLAKGKCLRKQSWKDILLVGKEDCKDFRMDQDQFADQTRA